jgi:U3 small nucleolar ribonucleoprotein component
MADKSAVPLPIATTEYDEINETITRRTIEQTFQDINSDIGKAKRKQDTISSKAIRRHQFLLMGVSGG